MKKFLPSIVLFLLALALLAWVWMFNHMLKNERSMAKTREKEWITTYLVSVGEKFEKKLNHQLSSADDIWNSTINGNSEKPPYLDTDLSGVWKKRELSMEADQPLNQQANNLLKNADTIDLDTFLYKVETGEWKLGWIEEGRDITANTALRLLGNRTNTKQSQRLTQFLWERVNNYTQPPIRPGFRLLIIEEIINNSSLSKKQIETAKRIQLWETFQAVRGDENNLPSSAHGQVIQYNETTKVYYHDDSLSEILTRASHGPAIEILEIKPTQPERIAHWIQLGNNSYWLTLADPKNSSSPDYGQTRQVITWLGALSGLLLIGGGGLAVWVARRDLRLARLRTDLAASVAHELRTPLAGQRLVLETLLLPHGQSETEQQEYLDMAFRENQRLSQLAEEFLTFSRLERGVINLELTALTPHEIIQSATEILQSKWDSPDCNLTIDISNNLPLIKGDQQSLITALRNLLENSWKYTHGEKQICISAREESQGVWIEIQDNGIGLSEKDKTRIFKQFYRVDHKLSQEQGGLGLGLAIVKRITEALNGKLRVESELGKGSTFGIWLQKYS